MLKAESLAVHRYGHVLLDDINLEVSSQSLHVILGPNGAGKSSLLNALSGLLKADAGQVSLGANDIQTIGISERSLLMAVLLQEQLLDFPFQVQEVVSMGAYLVDKTLQPPDNAIVDAMKAMDVMHLAERDYTTLSGGEKQRAHLARLLVQVTKNTAYILLDEPLKAIDLKHQVAVMQRLRKMADAGMGVLLIVHDLSLAAQFADTVTLMDQGRIIQSGTPNEVMQPEILSSVFQTPINKTEVLGQTLFFAQPEN
jgi:iron complex transport system ATP-binding protein